MRSPRLPSGEAGFLIPLIAVVAVIFLAANSYFVIPPSEMGATRWMGGTVMQKTPLSPGLHFKVPFLEAVDMIQTSRSTYTLNDMPVYTNDNQLVHISISVIYKIPRSSVLNLLYNVGRSGNFDIDATILPVVQDRALAMFAQYNTLRISDLRGEIAVKMGKSVSSALHDLFGIDVLALQLTSISYSPTFVTSVEDAVRAKAKAVQAQNTVLQRKYEGQQTVVTAEAKAQARIAAANGDAKSELIRAAARAKAIETVGTAIKANEAYIEYQKIEKWDGKLPAYLGGSGAAFPMLGPPPSGSK